MTEEEARKEIGKHAVDVAMKFSGLSTSAFFEEVRGRMWPRPDEYDVRSVVCKMFADGELVLTEDWKVRCNI